MTNVHSLVLVSTNSWGNYVFLQLLNAPWCSPASCSLCLWAGNCWTGRGRWVYKRLNQEPRRFICRYGRILYNMDRHQTEHHVEEEARGDLKLLNSKPVKFTVTSTMKVLSLSQLSLLYWCWNIGPKNHTSVKLSWKQLPAASGDTVDESRNTWNSRAGYKTELRWDLFPCEREYVEGLNQIFWMWWITQCRRSLV